MFSGDLLLARAKSNGLADNDFTRIQYSDSLPRTGCNAFDWSLQFITLTSRTQPIEI